MDCRINDLIGYNTKSTQVCTVFTLIRGQPWHNLSYFVVKSSDIVNANQTIASSSP